MRLFGAKVRSYRKYEGGTLLYKLIIGRKCVADAFVEKDGPWSAVPHYSTSIADAWLVVELLKSMGRLVIIKADGLMSGDFEPSYAVQCGNQREMTRANTAPGAICKAALIALRG